MRHLDRATQIEHRDRLQRWADGLGPLCDELGDLVQSCVGPPAIGVVARRQHRFGTGYAGLLCHQDAERMMLQTDHVRIAFFHTLLRKRQGML